MTIGEQFAVEKTFHRAMLRRAIFLLIYYQNIFGSALDSSNSMHNLKLC